MEAELFHADRRTDWHDKANSLFSQFYKRAYKWNVHLPSDNFIGVIKNTASCLQGGMNCVSEGSACAWNHGSVGKQPLVVIVQLLSLQESDFWYNISWQEILPLKNIWTHTHTQNTALTGAHMMTNDTGDSFCKKFSICHHLHGKQDCAACRLQSGRTELTQAGQQRAQTFQN